MQRTSIEWTDFTANPIKLRLPNNKLVNACVKVSTECANCYAESIVRRYWPKDMGPFPGYSKAMIRLGKPELVASEIKSLLTSKQISGKKVFICDMTDAFGEWVPFELLDQLFAVFALRPDVTFQVLTKRPERMAEYLRMTVEERDRRWGDAACAVSRSPCAVGIIEELDDGTLPNVHLGTSCGNQEAVTRIKYLVNCPATVHWISAEPLLSQTCFDLAWIDWLVVGGESGPGARPCDLAWIRSIVEQCRAAGTKCFVKQLGSKPILDGKMLRLRDSKGGDPAEWPDGLNIREFPEVEASA